MKIWDYVKNIAEVIGAFIAYSILQVTYIRPKSYVFSARASILLTAFTVFVFWLLFLTYKSQLKKRNEWEFNEEPHWGGRKIGIAILAAVVMIVGQILIMHLIGGGTSHNQQELNSVQSQSNPVFLVMVTVVAPFCEEVIFRGMFFNIFFTNQNAWNKWIGIICCGFLFGMVHTMGVTKFLVIYWFMGCILAWVYLTTKDLRYSMLTHALNNIIGLI